MGANTHTETTTSKMTGANYLARAIADLGVTRVYAVPGQRVLPLLHHLQNTEGVAVHLARHEQGAAFMADMDSRNGGLGVVVTTSGPGATNALTGVAASFTDSVPLLVITAQAATYEFGQQGIQEGTGLGRNPDVQAMFKATVKRSIRPMCLDELPGAFAELMAAATQGRPGPVHLDIPSDLLLGVMEECPTVPVPTPSDCDVPAGPNRADIASLLAAMRAASRPVVAVGNGLGGRPELQTLLDLCAAEQIPVVNSFIAKRDVDQRHPWVAGTIGIFGMLRANRLFFEEADLIVALGMSFNALTTADWTPVAARSIVRVDLDTRPVEYARALTHTVRADVGEVVQALDEARRSDPAPPKSSRPPVGPPLDDERTRSRSSLLHPIDVMTVLNSFVDRPVTFVNDIGQNAYWAERYLYTRGDRRFHINGALGSMGHAVAGALGTFLAGVENGANESVICVCGDGGFLMGALEVSTAVAAGASIVWVVLDNQALGTQLAWFKRGDLPPVASELPPVDYVALARALGAESRTVRTSDDVSQAIDEALTSRRPTVLHVPIDPEPAPLPYVRAAP